MLDARGRRRLRRKGAMAEEGSIARKRLKELRALCSCFCQSELRLVSIGLSGALPSIGGSASRKLNRACPLRLNRLFSFPTPASIPSLCFYRVPRPELSRAQSLQFFREPAFCLSRTNFAQPFSGAPFEGPGSEKLWSSEEAVTRLMSGYGEV